MKTVGVLGGMGPEATLDFFARLLSRTRAARDQDHLHLLIDNNPHVPNRNEAVAGRGPSPGPVLATMARGLESAGADFLVMVCNTAHAFESDIRGAVSIPFLSLIALTVEEALRRKPELRCAGLLAASGCLEAGLYQRAFERAGVRVLAPEGEALESFMRLLYRVKAGDKSAPRRAEMKAFAEALLSEGAEMVIAGCTEVPLVLAPEDLAAELATDFAAGLVDSTEVLVEATLLYAREGTLAAVGENTAAPGA